ncbi:ExbD/TolR family protein [Croceicoccus naphthovorans]|uniref:Biopolymer transporter ExbD n=1 Tax=Croceicoccus naphthovorans TaxID=1348774 RepID=A0A0G3XKC5_9SPHN|nr:biopolymer transporter ExbD [Croceicoccus naphthovorans]AKM10858.1 biopolymer transporter ExbD [Croceicoccus naphthovorans]MBB3989084.1 biopolymer transport protein ExbD [Croceicoccus naphthovorans]
MAMTATASHDDPMMEMNTTPLIDVMLVLLIMFVITIPIATHTTPVELPTHTDDLPGPLSPVVNKIVLTNDDAILWNGTAVTQADLPVLLAKTRTLPIEPELQFEPEERAGYAISANIVATIKQSGVSRFGFVGNDRFRDFGSGPSGVNPTLPSS